MKIYRFPFITESELEIKNKDKWKSTNWISFKKGLHFVCLLILIPMTAQSNCKKEGAIAAAKEVSKGYCSQYQGCDFKANWITNSFPGKYSPQREWSVTVSQIHSYDKNGKPIFRPEGSIFIFVSEACAPTFVEGYHWNKTIGEWKKNFDGYKNTKSEKK